MHLARRRKASSLVITLLVITVLTVIIVAFMQSMSLERRAALSYSNITKAELAAQAAQAEAVGRLASLMAKNPYHAIGYTNLTVNGKTLPYPMLYGATHGTNANAVLKTYVLCSSTTASTNSLDFTNLPVALDTTNSTAVNRRTDGTGDANDPGWIGSPVINGAISYRECRVPWVYLTKNPSAPHDKVSNPWVARYAWWIEDETSRVDLGVAGNNTGAGNSFQPARATNASAPSDSKFLDVQIVKPSQADLGAIPINNGQPIGTNASGLNNSLITFRNAVTNLPPDGRIFAQSTAFPVGSEAKARFYTTMSSVANDLAGNGMRRVNINALVHDDDMTANRIASDLDDITYAIAGEHSFKTNNSIGSAFFVNNTNAALLPDFGNRIYPGNTSPVYKTTYLMKIAANIRDYITAPTNNPTFVDFNGKVFAGNPPPTLTADPSAFPHNLRLGNQLMPRAIGQRPLPYFHKHSYAFRIISYNAGTLSFTMDEHFSFYNPTTRDFVAPANSFLRIYNRFRWNNSTVGTVAADDVEIDISGRTFPAGRTTVVTTSPDAANDLVYLGSEANVIRPDSSHPLKNLTRNNNDEQRVRKFNLSVGSLPLSAVARGDQGHDYQTMMVIGNQKGYYSGHGSVITTQASRASIVASGTGAGFSNDNSSTYLTSSSLCGNDAISRSGDPRSLNESLEFSSTYSNGVGAAPNQKDQDRFYFGSTPLDQAVINPYVNPFGNSTYFQWPDLLNSVSIQDDVKWAYGVIRCAPMTSIGELGNIYDPHRKPPIAGDPVIYARGGGRSLRIGQPDDIAGGPNAARFSMDWLNAAWRLTDVFEVVFKPDPDDATKQIVNREDAEAPAQSLGKININSALRDDGYALRTLLRRFVHPPQPYDDNNLGGKSWSETEINALIGETKAYLTNKGPMMERGEISQLAFFNGTNNSTDNGYPLKTTMDRGREALVRSIIPMLTTRSSSFTVYAVGQAVREDRSGKITPLAEAMKGETSRFNPVFEQTASAYRRTATNYSVIPQNDRY